MAKKRMVLQMGSGTDVRGGDYTKASVRALENALRRNALTVYAAFGCDPERMHVEVTIACARPDAVDADAVARCLPYGTRTVRVVEGGLDMPREEGREPFVLAQAAAVVYLDLEVV